MQTYLFITTTDYYNNKMTGAHRRFLELVRGVAKTNKVILVSTGVPQLEEEANIQQYRIKPCTLRAPAHIKSILELCKGLSKIKSKIHYDHAISFHATNTFCYKVCGYKHIVSLFREDLVGYHEALGEARAKVAYFGWLERTAVMASEKIIVQCKHDREALLSRYENRCKGLRDKLYIQVNNANASWMNLQPVQHIKTGDPVPKFLFIGNFSDERKGHKPLLEAAKELLDDGCTFQLFLAGDGKQFDYYKNKYQSYKQIVFLGRVTDMNKYFQICDFEIVPSLIDSCPNTVLEAINAGVAVYGANRGGIPDLLQEERYLFEPDGEHIARFLRDIIDNNRYKDDAVKQRKLKEMLSFDWAHAIEEIVEG